MDWLYVLIICLYFHLIALFFIKNIKNLIVENCISRDQKIEDAMRVLNQVIEIFDIELFNKKFSEQISELDDKRTQEIRTFFDSVVMYMQGIINEINNTHISASRFNLLIDKVLTNQQESVNRITDYVQKENFSVYSNFKDVQKLQDKMCESLITIKKNIHLIKESQKRKAKKVKDEPVDLLRDETTTTGD
jgi:hypothetical protein